MPKELYSWRFKKTVPLLTEDEYAIIEQRLSPYLNDVSKRIMAIRKEKGVSLEKATALAIQAPQEAIDLYLAMGGIPLENIYQFEDLRLKNYGAPCKKCGLLRRAPRARLCVSCGYQLPEGKVCGPAA